jgi:hypothetical protein
VFALFRRLTPAVVCMTVAGIAGVWTMGFATLLDRHISVFTSAVPAIVLTVAFSDIVHLWSAFQSELANGRDREDAVMASAMEVGRACMFTSATTGLGFLAMALVPTPMFRLLGVVLSFGVAVSLLLAMTLVPLLLVRTGPRAVTTRQAGWTQQRVSALLGLCHHWSSAHPRRVVSTFAVLLGLVVWGSSQLVVETNFNARFDDDAQLRQDQRWFESHFAGTSGFDLFVSTDGPDQALSPDVIHGLSRWRDHVNSWPDVDRTQSLLDVFEPIHAELGQTGPLPSSQAALSQYLLLFELGGGEALDGLLDFERRTLRIHAQHSGHDLRRLRDVGDRAAAALQTELGTSARVEVTGLRYLFGDWLDLIVTGQLRGFTGSCLLITLMMIWALGSVRAGMLSMVPNILPLLCLGAWCGLAWDQTDSDVFMIAMMAVGIGVDDTIHFLVRYRMERARSPDAAQALHRTFEYSGRAIVMTTTILVLGFLPFATSDYFSTRMIGVLLPGVLLVALISDVLLAPALCRLGAFGFSGPVPERVP